MDRSDHGQPCPLSLVHTLAAADLVDQYRLITSPTVLGDGERLFAPGTSADFRFVTVEAAAALTARAP